MGPSRRDFIVGGAALLSGIGSARMGWAAGNQAPIQVVNGAPGNGLDFVLRNGATGSMYQPESMAGGLGVIDFDGDGWPDLYCVNGATMPQLEKADASYWNRLYRNNRDGTFSDVTERAGVAGRGFGIGVAVGDYDNDGYEDLFVVGVHGNQLFHNNGNGTFSEITQAAGLNLPSVRKLWSIAAAWVDYDRDGKLDLFISNCCDWAPGLDPICGGATASSRLYCHPDKYRAEGMQLFHNNGNGTFTEVTGKGPLAEVLGKGMGIAVADFAGPGHLGLFVANDNARNLLFFDEGRGFRETGLFDGVAYNSDGRSLSGMGAAFGDIDGDGRFDLVMTALKNEGFGVFMNQGNDQFEDGSVATGLINLTRPVSGWGCGLVDLDNDGWLDLFVAAGGLDANEEMPNRIFRNVKGKFTDASDASGIGLAPPRFHRGCVFADFDHDGRLDIAVTALNGATELWWNRSPMQNWLKLRLIGTRSNRSAIGAQVTCKTATQKQIRCVTSSVGYASSSDLTVHFGLGNDRRCEIEIFWPSGVAQKLADVAANQQIEIKETQ